MKKNLYFKKKKVDSVLWMDLDECVAVVGKNQIRNCIYPEGLEMVKDTCRCK